MKVSDTIRTKGSVVKTVRPDASARELSGGYTQTRSEP
jgi:hypothetical protein